MIKVKLSTLKTLGILVVVLCILGALVLLQGKSTAEPAIGDSSVVTIKEGVQEIAMTVKLGFSPKIIQAKANVPTVLHMVTKNTFDCSSSIVIASLGYRKVLPASGTTDLDLGVRASGTEINGTCVMGMYNFKVKFN